MRDETAMPPGWRSTRLGDLAEWQSGGTPSTDAPEYWDGDIPWISAASLRDFEITDSERRITKRGATAGSRLVPPGTTILVVRGMSLKTEVRVGITQREVAFGQDCKALLPNKDVNPRYLTYLIKACESHLLTLVDEAGHGTGRLETHG